MKQKNSLISCWYSNEQGVKPVIQSDGMCKELHPLELDASKGKFHGLSGIKNVSLSYTHDFCTNLAICLETLSEP